ncbi:polygalacturonase inhibitor-like [Salvia divinorum]|uniref:Polygalacturonase inhibitor-like n=1 Tax=Salvia divinorum TaxID=28513 RepID=A0ABD1FW88_SALDI
MNHLSLFTILSLLVTILSQSPHSLSEKCNPKDKQALLSIKKAFKNDYYFASWEPATDCCDWYIVRCDYTNSRIISLEIFEHNLSGSIPRAVSDLPFLETLVIHTTNISGPVPSNLSQLKNLKYLRLDQNSLSGSIPPSLAQISSLTSLFLGHNKLTGALPKGLASLPALRDLDVSYNRLCGRIPTGGIMQKVDSSSYSNNKCLCGSPLPNCK